MENADNARQVLVVEDDADTRDALRQALECEGYGVMTAPNGAVALELLRTGTRVPAMILLDLRMPVMDGWTFCEARRGDPKIERIPVVILSGEAGNSRLAPYAGVAAVLAKPVAADRLLALVERFATDAVV